MTIIYSRYVEPVLASEATSGKRSPKPPPRIWHATDPPFKGYQPAPSEGYQQSSRDTAIVIDNGTHGPSTILEGCLLMKLKALALCEPAGRSTLSLGSHSHQMWLDIVIESTTEPSRTLDTMHMRTLQLEASLGMLSSLGPALWAIGMRWKAYWIRYS